jgi:energy-coupling factor transport system ATP-binding protein
MALIATNASFTYDVATDFGIRALADVTLTLTPGELVVVAGTTGSGKSTLLRLLAGLLAPVNGSVTADGAGVGASAARGRVAIVFQNPEAQFFAETVREDVMFGPRNLGALDPGAVADEALDRIGLDPATFGPRSPFTLSGGEARRVAIAGALALGAGYLLLDEPTAGLDAAGRYAVMRALASERARAGLMVVTHDPEEFFDQADRVVALDAGSIAFDGSVSELIAEPAPFEAAGLRLPEVLRLQLLARARGASLPEVSLDPEAAAAALCVARGVES